MPFALGLFTLYMAWDHTPSIIFLAILYVQTAIMHGVLWQRHPVLFWERMTSHKRRDLMPYDRLFVWCITLAMHVCAMQAAYVSRRRHTGNTVAMVHYPYASDACMAVLSVFLGIFNLCPAYNVFFSSHVHIQKGHTVCDKGPYAMVRHPGYTCLTGVFLVLPAALRCLQCGPLCAMAILCIYLRTKYEDAFLMMRLYGYTDYAHRVKWRLIPEIY